MTLGWWTQHLLHFSACDPPCVPETDSNFDLRSAIFPPSTANNHCVQAAHCGVGSHFNLTGQAALDTHSNIQFYWAQHFLPDTSGWCFCGISATTSRQLTDLSNWSFSATPFLIILQETVFLQRWFADPDDPCPVLWERIFQAAYCGVGSQSALTGLAALDYRFLWHFTGLFQRDLFGVGSHHHCSGPFNFGLIYSQLVLHIGTASFFGQQYPQAALCGVGSHCTLTGLAAWGTSRWSQLGVGSPFIDSFPGRLRDPWHFTDCTGLDIPSDCSNNNWIFLDFTDSFQFWQPSDTTSSDWGGLPIFVFSWPNLQVDFLQPTLLYGAGPLAFVVFWWTFLCCISFSKHQIFDPTPTQAVSSDLSTAVTDPDKSGKSGPNSRRRIAVSKPGGFHFLLWTLVIMSHSYRGEGWSPPMGTPEVRPWTSHVPEDWTKQHGQQPTMSFGSSDRLETNVKEKKIRQVVKRSMNRAFTRAQEQGFAWYRGRCYSATALANMGCKSTSRPTAATQSQDLARCNQIHAPKRRLTTWQWNCGGLSSAKLDELKAWLFIQKVDLAVIVETRWCYDGEWQDPHWHCLHSGEGAHRGKGILILISKRLGPASQLKWQFHASGRLVHLRLNCNPRPIDILACYQHTFNRTTTCLKARDTWWTLLNNVLHSLPHRHNLIMLGDFNCSLSEQTNAVGSPTFVWRQRRIFGTYHSDHSRFLQILRQHDLIALNAGSAALGPTFVHGDCASRLDYICVRRMFADQEARRVQYLWNSPFIEQTFFGHTPILCSIARHWIPTYDMHRFQKITAQQREHSRQAFLTQTPAWRSFVETS